MANARPIQVDISKVRSAIETCTPLTVTTYTLPHEMEEYMAEVLTTFLSETGQAEVIEPLSYCMRELVNNAKKANTKRVYFEEMGLDIFNAADYEKGMATFKQDTLTNIDHYLKIQKEKGLYVKLTLQVCNNRVRVEIRNNVPLTVFEYYRMHDKINRAQQFDSVEEGLSQLLDDSEGAGLGLVMMILVLRKIGVTEENYQIISAKGETITRLLLPLDGMKATIMNSLSQDFVDLIDGLPQFPENITAINRVMNDPNSHMSDIAQKISNDVSLTGELLKLVNSAAFALPSPCTSITDAVKFLGLRGVKNLLYSVGSVNTLLGVEASDKKEFWDHSYRVASYAFNIARAYCRAPAERSCIEDSYVCGLLHDMGKIIFQAAHPDLLAKIAGLCEEKGIAPSLFERLAAGMNHGEIGALVAEKWNFPAVITSAIRYHHSPTEAPMDMRTLVNIVYLSDMIDHYIDGTVDYTQFDYEVLDFFKIDKEETLKNLSNKLALAFKK